MLTPRMKTLLARNATVQTAMRQAIAKRNMKLLVRTEQLAKRIATTINTELNSKH